MKMHVLIKKNIFQTGFPDIPTVSYDAPNSTFCNDFVMIDGPNPNLRSDNASGQSVCFPKNIRAYFIIYYLYLYKRIISENRGVQQMYD